MERTQAIDEGRRPLLICLDELHSAIRVLIFSPLTARVGMDYRTTVRETM